MAINISKTKQIIFRRPNLHRPEAINYIAGVELVDCLKVLGVFVHENLNQPQHVNYVVGIAKYIGVPPLRSGDTVISDDGAKAFDQFFFYSRKC